MKYCQHFVHVDSLNPSICAQSGDQDSYLHCDLPLGYKGELGRGIYTGEGMFEFPGRTAGLVVVLTG